MKNNLLMSLFVLFSWNCMAQETEWEPQKHLTGYINLEGNYFNFKNDVLFERKYGISLAEAGLLADYQLLKKLTLKAVLVYRPDFSFDNMLNEANAEYKVADYFLIKAGRMLTPLSPMNTYYYAPVNNSVTLPMVISHHEFFPLNIDALSLNGKLGNNIKVDYNVFTGGFHNTLWLRTGALGFFGVENSYFEGDTALDDNESTNNKLCFAHGGHIGVSYSDIITVGANIFKTEERVGTTISIDMKKFSYGFNLKLKLNSLQLIGETWYTTVEASKYHIKSKYKGTFAELSYSLNKLIPYARFENEDIPSLNYKRYTAGINYKPSYETAIKLEYMLYEKSPNLHGVVASVIYSF
jgi:hypothetical protein